MIRDILILQERELRKKLKEHYIDRQINRKKIDNPLIKVIIGPRRAGKSFFALHFLNKKEKFSYVNFDDERLIDLKDYDELMQNLDNLYNNSKNVLFDEIQNLPRWELFLNRLYRQGYNIFVTGSNSKLLSKELATHLTGRHSQINIFPFSFKEYLELNKKEKLTNNEIKSLLEEYLVRGGYPEIKIKDIDYKEYLSTLFDSVIYKDIVKRYKVRYPNKIEDLAFYLLSNIANEYSFNSLIKITKIQSSHTIEKYLGYLEEAFIFFSLKRFSYKVKEQFSPIKKVYCIDNGIINAKAFKISPDFGKLYENLVAIELKRKEMNNQLDLFYWQNQQKEEVDFVIKEGTRISCLIQVCYNLNNPKVKQRETRSLIKAGVELKCKNLVVITKDYEKKEKMEWFGKKTEISFVPLWKWLLDL
ncbi:MAG: ATP-binding protein [Nanoarchaeota archaeon]|nr:ATP-binding protein [Nanoarchaeota archaeon]